MKKHIALILALTLSVALFAGCGENGGTDTSAAPVPSDVASASSAPGVSTTPINTGDDSTFEEIPLDTLTNPRYIAVDDSSNIYVGDEDTVYVIGADRKPVPFIEGLITCRGLSVVGDVLYVFDARDDLYLICYDLQGHKHNEQRIALPENPQLILRGYVFQTVPVAFVDFGQDCDPYIYNMETHVSRPIVTSGDYTMMWPTPDGTIVCVSRVIGKTVILTINNDSGVTATEYDQNLGSYIQYLYDLSTDMKYGVNAQSIDVLKESGKSVIAISPYMSDGERMVNIFDSLAQKGILYFLMKEEGKSTVFVCHIPEITSLERRTLRIMYNAGLMEYHTDFLRHFRTKYPEIDVVEVPVKNDIGMQTTYLQLLSGELDVDIITANVMMSMYRFSQAGITMDLSIYPNIVSGLKNPNLLDGVWENCLNPDGTLFGVPYNAAYDALVVNTELFIKYGLSIPKINWTHDDYYILAKEVIRLNNEINAGIYMHEGMHDAQDKLGLVYFWFTSSKGFNSSNGYIPRYDTQEMIDYADKNREIYEAFPFFDYRERSLTNTYDDVLLSRPNNIMTDDEVKIVPYPADMYGNRRSVFSHYLTIYSKAKNPDDAALFISEFLSEDWHRNNVTEIQLFKNTSLYKKINCSESIAAYIEDATKNIVHYAYNNDIEELYYELEAKFFAGQLTTEQFVQEMQKGVEKRILG